MQLFVSAESTTGQHHRLVHAGSGQKGCCSFCFLTQVGFGCCQTAVTSAVGTVCMCIHMLCSCVCMRVLSKSNRCVMTWYITPRSNSSPVMTLSSFSQWILIRIPIFGIFYTFEVAIKNRDLIMLPSREKLFPWCSGSHTWHPWQ